jgi:XapX domain-containing protein
MKAYLLSFAVGCGVGLIYAALRVKSPAPPLVALIGLLGMLLGEGGFAWIKALLAK